MMRGVLGGLALALMSLAGFALLVLTVMSVAPVGFIHAAVLITSLVTFFVPTPRSWAFLAAVCALVALVPALTLAWQLLQPSTAEVARVWSRSEGWVDLERPSLSDVLATAGVIGSGLFLAYAAALFLWKLKVWPAKGMPA